MAGSGFTAKPTFGPAETWGACSRCGARVRYSTLARERLTGLLVCTPASGRSVRSCWDPWPEVLDFQAFPDRSIEPPPEPLPARWNLDSIWGASNNPAPAPDDATRLQSYMAVPYYAILGRSAAFAAPPITPSMASALVVKINPADYDGTFLPSSSIRTVTPPDEAEELRKTSSTDVDVPQDKLWSPPWAAVKQV